MSVKSDDTDLLLLIPPDFFSVKSDSEDCAKDLPEKLLVSDLISQVNDLEGRICMIENQGLAMPGNLQQLRHFGSADALNTSCKLNYNSRSLQTTPLKTQTLPLPCKSWRNGTPSKYSKRTEHHNLLESHQYVNQKERDDKLLKEINDFFRQKNSFLNEEDKSENESLHLSTAVFNLNKVNDLLKQLEETQAEIEAKLKLKGLNNDDDSDETDQLPQTLNKVSSYALKSTSFSDSKSPRRLLDFDSLSPRKKEKNNVSSVADTLTEECVDIKPDEVEDGQEKKLESQTEISNLLSLCNLWGASKNGDDGKISEDQTILRQKYQEEKCRRQHCEELIQKLQLRLLEEQQKIAVAIKVDKEKDEAISKLTEGWNKLLSSWKELENQKNACAKKLQSEREKFQNEVAVACQTVKRYEAELSKALDLAHGYKEKCELSDQERKNLTVKTNKELESLKTELRSATEKLQKEKMQNEKLEKLAAAKEETISQSKSKILEMQSQIRELKKAIKDHQTETEILKHEKDKLAEKLKEEKSRVSGLEQSKKTLSQMNEELKRKEKSLKENVKSMGEQMDKIKIDLKQFYQDQVEKIVQEKLKEFQEQLATAEKALQRELEERERTVSDMAVKQVQQIVEKHVQEVNLLEEKHKEEVELWKVKFLQTEEKVRELQKKLEHYSSHKTEIAQKLQTVMETQWQEALKIITASSPQHQKSPLNSGRSDSERAINRQNTFTMLTCGLGEGNLNKNGFMDSETEHAFSEAPFCTEGQITYREHKKPDPKTSYRIDETPQKIDSETTDPLKKYIQMLLERPPGLSVDGSVDVSFDSTAFNSLADGSGVTQWQHILVEMRYIYIDGVFIPKHCIYGPRQAEGIIIENYEWWRITDHLVREQKEKELAAALKAKEEAKKELSKNMTSDWSNTLASIKTQDNQKRLEIEEKEKQSKIDQYNTILKNREEERKRYCEEMRKITYQDGDEAKTINSAVLYSLVLDERRQQLETLKLKKPSPEKDLELLEKYKSDAEDFYKERQKERIKEKEKKYRQKLLLDAQMEDIRKRKQKEVEEFEAAKQDVINMIRENERIQNCQIQERVERRKLAQKCLQMIERKIEHQKKLALEEEIEDEINDIYAHYDRLIKKERKCREQKIKDEQVAERIKISDMIAQKMLENATKEEAILASSIREGERRAQKEEEQRRERYKNALADILDGKKKAEERRERERYERKEKKKWELIQQYRSAEVDEEWRQAYKKFTTDVQRDVRKGLDCQVKQKAVKDARERKEWLTPLEDQIRDREDLENYCKDAEDFAKEYNLPDYPIRAAIAKVKRIFNRNDFEQKQKEEDARSECRKQKSRPMASGCYCLKY